MDIFRKLRPDANERRLVFVGRLMTGLIVVLSIAWLPFIKYLSNEIYQYLQSVQAYVGAPITATFLVGVLWKRATARAAIVTLIAGGLTGASRFLLDVLHSALHWDLGPFNQVVAFSFLNFSVIVFLLCVLLMVAISLMDHVPGATKTLGLTWERGAISGATVALRSDVTITILVGAFILGLWIHFR